MYVISTWREGQGYTPQVTTRDPVHAKAMLAAARQGYKGDHPPILQRVEQSSLTRRDYPPAQKRDKMAP